MDTQTVLIALSIGRGLGNLTTEVLIKGIIFAGNYSRCPNCARHRTCAVVSLLPKIRWAVRVGLAGARIMGSEEKLGIAFQTWKDNPAPLN